MEKINDQSTKINIKFIFIGFFLSQKITLIGQIYFLEIFSILYLIFNFRKIKFNLSLKKLFIILLFHLLIVTYTDYLNKSSLDLYLKGFFSLPIFFVTILFLFTYFNKKYFLFVNFLIGFLLGDNFINNYINDYNPFFFGNPIKWGIGLLFLSLIFLFDEFNKKKISLKKTLVITLILSIIILTSGARALPLTIFFAQILFIFSIKTNILELFNSKKTFFLLSLIVFISTGVLGLLPGKINSIKYFNDINEKNISQNSGGFGVVAAAKGYFGFMIFGLILSVVLTGTLATYMANYIQRHIWIAYVGLIFILIVGLQLIIGGLNDYGVLSINETFKKYF